jgi:hypothetical protein
MNNRQASDLLAVCTGDSKPEDTAETASLVYSFRPVFTGLKYIFIANSLQDKLLKDKGCIKSQANALRLTSLYIFPAAFNSVSSCPTSSSSLCTTDNVGSSLVISTPAFLSCSTR